MSIVPSFRKAQRQQCKAAIVLDGLSGQGKSGLALALAYGLAHNWNDVAAVDTENRSLDLYVGQVLHTGVRVEDFNVGDLTADDGYKPSYYSAYRDEAIKQGYKVIINDSISHMWTYEGGVLDMVNTMQRANPRANQYAIWGDPAITSEKNKIISMIRHPKIHCINTLRVKEKMEFIPDENGKLGLRSLGEQQIIMPDFKYEPDLVLSLLEPGSADGHPPKVIVSKSRYAPLKVNETYNMTTEMIEQLRLFLEEGTSPEELEEMQRQDYIEATTAYLETHSSARAIWTKLKEKENVSEIALKDIPLAVLKRLYSLLVA